MPYYMPIFQFTGYWHFYNSHFLGLCNYKLYSCQTVLHILLEKRFRVMVYFFFLMIIIEGKKTWCDPVLQQDNRAWKVTQAWLEWLSILSRTRLMHHRMQPYVLNQLKIEVGHLLLHQQLCISLSATTIKKFIYFDTQISKLSANVLN